jgi:hypothetical protein
MAGSATGVNWQVGALIKDERGGNRHQDSGASHAPFGISQIGFNEVTGINVSDGLKTDETCRFENRVLAMWPAGLSVCLIRVLLNFRIFKYFKNYYSSRERIR